MSTRKTAPAARQRRALGGKAATLKAASRAGTGGTIGTVSGAAVETAAVKALRKVMARKAQGRAGIQVTVAGPGETAVQVLGAQPAGAGRVYQVLAPVTPARHLSSEDVQSLVREMVAQQARRK